MERATYIGELRRWANAEHPDLVANSNYSAIAAAANERPKTVEQRSIPRSYTFSEIYRTLAAADPAGVQAALQGVAILIPTIKDAVEENDREAMADWMGIVSTFLNEAGRSALASMLAASDSVSVTIYGDSVAEINGWPTVRAEDAQEALGA